MSKLLTVIFPVSNTFSTNFFPCKPEIALNHVSVTNLCGRMDKWTFNSSVNSSFLEKNQKLLPFLSLSLSSLAGCTCHNELQGTSCEPYTHTWLASLIIMRRKEWIRNWNCYWWANNEHEGWKNWCEAREKARIMIRSTAFDGGLQRWSRPRPQCYKSGIGESITYSKGYM